jgi:hypothetical protein
MKDDAVKTLKSCTALLSNKMLKTRAMAPINTPKKELRRFTSTKNGSNLCRVVINKKEKLVK